jgi:sugar phosphate isomerase/epimerase
MRTGILAGYFFAIFFVIGMDGLGQTPPVPGLPIGRCVRVIGVTAPEDAKAVGFEYVELALQDILPLSEKEFEQTVTRIRGLGIPALSGYGFLPADLKVVGPDTDQSRVYEHLRRGIARAARLGLKMVVFGNHNGQSRSAPADFSRDEA